MTDAQTYGYFGKLPCTGDFLRHGLSYGFVSGWDQWNQDVLIAGQDHFGDKWVDTYMNAPIWRFAIAAGVCGPRSVAGIWMPSVDRVGRRFPFCIASESDLPAWEAYLALQPVITRVEDAALVMLSDDAKISDLESTLSALPAPAIISNTAGGGDPANAIFVASVTDQSRVLLAPTLPEPTALFDLDAPADQELCNDPI